jgi:hypothetical protein
MSRLLLCARQRPGVTTDALRWIPNIASANGRIFSVQSLSDPDHRSLAALFPGKDLSNSFPAYTLLGRLPNNNSFIDADLNRCIGNRVAIADRWLSIRLRDPSLKVENGRLVNCPLPSGGSGPCFFAANDRQRMAEDAEGGMLN